MLGFLIITLGIIIFLTHKNQIETIPTVQFITKSSLRETIKPIIKTQEIIKPTFLDETPNTPPAPFPTMTERTTILSTKLSTTPQITKPTTPQITKPTTLTPTTTQTGGQWFKGTATWYCTSTDNVCGVGFCGLTVKRDEMSVALPCNVAQEHCGKYVEIRRNGKTVRAQVRDCCPDPVCQVGHHLDLAGPTFSALGNLDDGVIDIEWRFV